MRFRALALAIACLAATPIAAQEVTPRQITVTGEGEVAAAPDTATLHLGIVVRRPTGGAAMDQLSDAAGDLFDTLTDAGIAETAIQTAGLALEPLRDPPQGPGDGLPPIRGYEARTDVTVQIDTLDGFGALLDDVTGGSTGIAANQIRGVDFGLSDPQALRDRARRQAVDRAMAQAQLYAEATGVTLGEVLEVREEGGVGPQPMARSMMAEGMPIAAGQITVSASVTLVMAID